MTTSLFDEPPSIASFREYPTEKPFLNSGIARLSKPVKAYPENSSEAVLSALKELQDKIINLEIDRSKAEKNLKVLAAETSAYKTLLNRPTSPIRSPTPGTTPAYSPRNLAVERRVDGAAQIESQLRNADTRCELLERQLDNMRRMVQNAERERSDALERQIALERDRGRITAENRTIQSKLDKMEFIQTRFDDMMSRKEKSEIKIKELEAKLKEEEHQRKLLIDRAAQIQTVTEVKRILNEDEHKSVPTKSKKKKKKSTKAKKQTAPSKRSLGPPHYRLNLADVPFITGTSTSPSHAVSANVQKLLYDLKQHNPKLCNKHMISKKTARSSESSSSDAESKRGRPRVSHYSTSNKDDLKDLLVALQDEFGKSMFEHQVLVKQMGETADPEMKQDLKQELQGLVSKMERKGEQISTVKRHIAQLGRKKTKRSESSAPIRAASPPIVRIGTRISHSSSPRCRLVGERNRRLAFLKDMRNVRSALHKEDLSWD